MSSERCHGERGATLALALVIVTAVGLLVAGLARLATNSMLSTDSLRTQRALEYAAQGATDAAVQAVRYTYNAYTTTALCTPGGTSSVITSSVAVEVYCSGSVNVWSGSTRVVNFYACSSGTLQGPCTSTPVVRAQVTFDDYSTANAYHCGAGAANPMTCGSGMTINSWIVGAGN